MYSSERYRNALELFDFVENTLPKTLEDDYSSFCRAVLDKLRWFTFNPISEQGLVSRMQELETEWKSKSVNLQDSKKTLILEINRMTDPRGFAISSLTSVLAYTNPMACKRYVMNAYDALTIDASEEALTISREDLLGVSSETKLRDYINTMLRVASLNNEIEILKTLKEQVQYAARGKEYCKKNITRSLNSLSCPWGYNKENVQPLQEAVNSVLNGISNSSTDDDFGKLKENAGKAIDARLQRLEDRKKFPYHLYGAAAVVAFIGIAVVSYLCRDSLMEMCKKYIYKSDLLKDIPKEINNIVNR